MKHKCSYPTCDKQVADSVWGCHQHWFTLPIALRRKIWANPDNRHGPVLRPSHRFLDPRTEAEDWCIKHILANGSLEDKEILIEYIKRAHTAVHIQLDKLHVTL